MSKKIVAPRKMGRPSEYHPKFCDEIIEYFSKPPYEQRTKKVITKSGDVIETPYDAASDTPTFAGFACLIGHHRETLIGWTKAHPDFFDAYNKAKEFQENFLVVNGNKGLINSPFAIFTAKNVLKWRDKQPGEEDTVIVNNNHQSLSETELDARIAKLEKVHKAKK